MQLVAKHPALACVPPNATITKAKGMSLALGRPMQVWMGRWGDIHQRKRALRFPCPCYTDSITTALPPQVCATLMAKEPGVLCCCASPPGELNRDLKPHVEDIQEVGVRNTIPQLRCTRDGCTYILAWYTHPCSFCLLCL